MRHTGTHPLVCWFASQIHEGLHAVEALLVNLGYGLSVCLLFGGKGCVGMAWLIVSRSNRFGLHRYAQQNTHRGGKADRDRHQQAHGLSSHFDDGA